MGTNDFPGADQGMADRLTKEVVEDEKAIVHALRNLRTNEAVSLEEVGFLLDIGAGQISRYLGGQCGISLKNYLRIVRALGYRCRVVFERAEEAANGEPPARDQRITPLRALRQR